MEVSIELPDQIVERLSTSGRDLPRQLIEALAAESYRGGLLTSREVQQLLGLESRWAVEAFLKAAGVSNGYTPADLEEDRKALDGLLGK